MEFDLKPRVLVEHGEYKFWLDGSGTSGKLFYAEMGRFFSSREVHKELGGSIFDSPEHIWVLVKHEREVVGFGSMDASRFEKSGIVFLDWMYIVPEHRKKGLYAKLFEVRLTLAKEMGTKIVRGATSSAIAHRMFKKHGFYKWQDRGSWIYYEKEMK